MDTIDDTLCSPRAGRSDDAGRPFVDEAVPARAHSRLDRLLARIVATRLDARLAHGAAPDGRLLAARAARLTSKRHRAELADAWDRVLSTAHGTGAVLDTRAPVDRAAVREAAPQIAGLVEVLRSPASLRAGGIARARALLADGTSAVYSGGDLATQVADLVAVLGCRGAS